MQQREEYVNKGSDHLKGKTWDYYKRSNFAGTIIPISKAEKTEIIKEKAREYKEKNPEAEVAECIAWGVRFINRERKHHKAYLKGLNSYSYKGGKYLVEDESRLERFKQFALDLEEKAIKAQEEKEKQLVNETVEGDA